MTSLALYTTVYPGVARFLPAWYESVRRQTDKDFQLWIALDGLHADAVEEMLGVRPQATWVLAGPGDTPAQVRERALARIVESCDAVVLVDSDDVLHPTRVAAAREGLRDSDVTGCALRLVDESGHALDLLLELPPTIRPANVLPRHNIFGLSNSSFRSDLLRRCLPIPAEVALVDWFLVTRAWLCGARLAFDPVAHMDYRQHEANMARIRLPFTPDRVRSDTRLVRTHFEILQAHPLPGALPDRVALIEEVAADVEAFYRRIALDENELERYVMALNAAAPAPLWWSCVAYPPLQHLWTTHKEPT
jgi:hypothetical protein